MRSLVMAASLTLLSAAPLLAQSERGYLTGAGGFATTSETTSGDFVIEGGWRIAPNLMVFGNIGQFHNLQPSDVQAAVDTTTGLLSTSQGLDVTGTGRVPATYSVGGLRYQIPMRARFFSPYLLGGLGVARLSPTAEFTFTSGTATLPDGTTATPGANVTNALVTAGDFTAPAASTSFMYTLGGGVQIPIAGRWAADVGYRFSRIESETPLNAQGLTFGFGYRF
jgi:opacity protein-like surface antigen